MVYILNKNLKDSQKIRIALQGIYGVGSFLSHQICDQLGFSQKALVKDLTSFQKDQLVRIFQNYYFSGSELQRMVDYDIKRLIHIGSYRGFRHAASLPVRGQRTKTNAQTRRRSRKQTSPLVSSRNSSKKKKS
jgi:small subunit ribosomal protein S13